MECDYGRDPGAGTGNHGRGAKIDDGDDNDDDGNNDDSDGDYSQALPAPDSRAGEIAQVRHADRRDHAVGVDDVGAMLGGMGGGAKIA